MGSTLSAPAPATGGVVPSLGARSRIVDSLRPSLATAVDLLLLIVLGAVMAIVVVWAVYVALPDPGDNDWFFYYTGDLV